MPLRVHGDVLNLYFGVRREYAVPLINLEDALSGARATNDGAKRVPECGVREKVTIHGGLLDVGRF